MPGIKLSKLEDIEIVEIELACSVHALPPPGPAYIFTTPGHPRAFAHTQPPIQYCILLPLDFPHACTIFPTEILCFWREGYRYQGLQKRSGIYECPRQCTL